MDKAMQPPQHDMLELPFVQHAIIWAQQCIITCHCLGTTVQHNMLILLLVPPCTSAHDKTAADFKGFEHHYCVSIMLKLAVHVEVPSRE